MAGRFPGARNVSEFWHNLHEGIETISFFSDAELEISGVKPEVYNDPAYVRAKGVLSEVEMFDAAFFGFTPREAEIMDPQQRLFLECAWEALENAGYDFAEKGGRVGVYGGSGLSTYFVFNLMSNPKLLETVPGLQLRMLNDKDFLTTLVSYKLNLQGPSVAVQTACSTSLVATHLASQALLDGECDMALAGGVAVSFPHKAGYIFRDGEIWSPDGHCRAFDARARGTIEGNGAGVVVLKRLDNALRDRDFIHGVILGSAINNDGALKAGYTAPSVESQSQVILEALAMAGVGAESIGYVEAHGSATPLGDPIEVRALSKAFRHETGKKNFCALGSVKTNFGHLDNAAGSASLIKTIEALKHKVVPPTLHFQEPNPQMELPSSPFYVNTSPIEWRAETGPRRAGVSSLGIGGTNAHLVLEEAPPNLFHSTTRSFQLLTLSARTESALDVAQQNLAVHLNQHPEFGIADVAHTLHIGRRSFRHRRMLVCSDRADAENALSNREPYRLLNGTCDAAASRVVMMFPGLGDHHPEMALDLYREEPVFREQIDRCAEILKPHLNVDLREVLYPGGTSPDALHRPKPASSFPEHRINMRRMLAADVPQDDSTDKRLNQTLFSHPAVFVIEYALARLLMDWGICPAAMIGYSLGEYVAACVAGVFSIEDALFLVTSRARLIEQLPHGTMLAIPLPEDEVRPFIGTGLSLAASDSPALSVIAGEFEAVEVLEDLLAARGVVSKRLQTSHAFHSHMMEPLLGRFREYVAMIELKPPQTPFISNVTGDWITAAEATDPHYWSKHLRQTVRFAEGVGELLRLPGNVLLEVGPGQALSTLVRQSAARQGNEVVLSTMRDRREETSDTAKLLTALGQLWLAGVNVSWQDFYRHEQRARVPLPTYPFERRRYWIEPGSSNHDANTNQQATEKNPDLADWFYSPFWKSSRLPAAPVSDMFSLDATRWLIFTDEAGLGSRIAARLKRFGAEVFTVARGERFAQDESDFRVNPAERVDYDALIDTLRQREISPTHIAHLWTLTPEAPATADLKAFDQLQEMGFYSLMFLAQALGEHELSAPLRIAVVSNNVYDVTGYESCCPHKATLWGPCKVIPQEYANIDCRIIDVTLSETISPDEVRTAGTQLDEPPQDTLAECIISELLTDSPERAVAYRGRRRWVRDFEAIRLNSRIGTSRPVRREGAYFITGADEMSLLLTEYLVRDLKAKVTLIAPLEFPSRDKWELWLGAHDDEDDISARIRRLRTLEMETPGRLLTIPADVCNESQMKAALDQSLERFGRLHGIVYAASVPGAGIIQLKMKDMAAAVLAPKTRGLLILTSLSEHMPLDFFALCSSTVAVAGGLGQVDSCAANAFLDAMAQRRSQRGKITVSIGWSAFAWDKWEIPGMMGSPALTKLQEQQQHSGISRAEVLRAFDHILDDPLAHVLVCPHDLSVVMKQTDMLTLENFVESIEELRPAGTHPRPHMNVAYVPPQNGIEQTIAEIWQEAFGIGQIGVADNFFDLAGNSLLAIQIVTRLRQAFRIDLPITSLFDAPTVSELARRIQDLQSGQLESTTLERMLTDIEELSAEEAEKIFVEELGAAGSDSVPGGPLAGL
jgi:acyl transferase domain-containing protein/acyl carrier protein